ncbi:313_t:CDS:1 [Dentiscutata erythropus]|uniref:313_t:CDS:1 n=1 Tax=Dentiscutata erythropus TaxID=1348616 RepID=A0A9N9FA55_9GLOM|nr:313_t:CDS:1 [Dentiscutata erythropus]
METLYSYCYTNKNINYRIQTTQWSEASNAHLKRLLSHTVPLPKLISALKKLSRHQLQHSQYQQYHLHGSICQQCPELLKDISMVILDFVYSILLKQYNIATVYEIEMQESGILQVYRNESYKHIVYQVETEYTCSCDYSTQYSLSCHHVLAVHITDKRAVSINYIGARWIISSTRFNITQPGHNLTNTDESATKFISFTNRSIYDIYTDQEKVPAKSTANLLEDIGTISNRVGHVKVNNSLAHFVKELNDEYPLLQEDIEDPLTAKTKGRPNNTSHSKSGIELATKRTYICSICGSNRHNSRSCPSK